MTAADIIKDLKAKKFKPVYLLHGEEPYYIDQIIHYMEDHILNDMEKGFNQTVLYGKDTDMATILNAAKRYPMMSDYQLIVVKEAQDLKWSKETEGSSKEAEFIQNYFEKPLDSTILVLGYKYANFDKRKKIFKSITKSGVVFQSDPVRDYKLAQWIEELVKGMGAKIAPQASALMAEYLGADLSKISNELEKLLLNISKETIIDTDLVQRNIGISKEYNVFELQKALASRNVLKCNQIINYFADNPKANPMVMVMANLNSYFSKILKYHYLQNKGDAAKELGVNPYFVKDYETAARNYNLNKTFDIISLLREYDLKSKGVDSTGNITDGELLKELLFKMIH
ncbi:DNA polymerase III subunit delta [Pedobacter cryoconitis]|jgi:DNA polymerase-3 subunit delta|uniref:DNA polymerase III subunit delta n=1 Tax=Pedobacter cryoconitis TaxID=188932 RepID=UPI00160A5283|nr:DNA polymerase III subunit delta [Pedobacter cryoconitis]MBB5649060.1 DNA polymerase-3 subunit delta [Pedobacter cryoconitis]